MRKSVHKSISILLTGTPGTGKTSMAIAWCKKNGWKYLSLNDIVEKKKLYSRIDKKDGAKIVKLGALEREANKEIARSSSPVLVEGHLGCELKLSVDRVLVLRLEPKELVRRLHKRSYSASKLQENKMVELLDYCTVRSIDVYGARAVYEMDVSDKSKKGNLLRFARFASARIVSSSFKPHVAWSAALEAEAQKSV
ncbi:Putative adenylate kinase [uncultured archaeon]|nr:Putative adenylate kinase [uncultured archaeon]